jgi:hypothetical protein
MNKPSATDDTMPSSAPRSDITLASFQKLIRDMYHEKDVARGIDGTFMWPGCGQFACTCENAEKP